MKTDKAKFLTNRAMMQWSGPKRLILFHLETLTTLRKYQKAQPSEQGLMRGELDETMNKVISRAEEPEKKNI